MSSEKSSMEDEPSGLVAPLDFSFKKLSCKEDVSKQKPRKNRLGRVPETGHNQRFITTSVWLGNNALQTTREASAILYALLEFPTRLAWLDLSFNQIYDVDETLLQFVTLKILYLHGNQIHNLAALGILRDLTRLRTLTLHGNPVDSIPNYRSLVVNILPQLSNLDFSSVLSSERKEAPPLSILEHMKSERKNPSQK